MQMLDVSLEEPERLPVCLLFAGIDSFVWICFGTRIENIFALFFSQRELNIEHTTKTERFVMKFK